METTASEHRSHHLILCIIKAQNPPRTTKHTENREPSLFTEGSMAACFGMTLIMLFQIFERDSAIKLLLRVYTVEPSNLILLLHLCLFL